jgi:eukaryotic-like serine/threonine-protein kinase
VCGSLIAIPCSRRHAHIITLPVTPGTRLGPYEIAAQIGVGGMGEVYLATDTNLARQVAIKVLPASVAADPDRLARFDREARTLAALNHPNIAAIYGLERSNGITALVMELVEGPTLADIIAGDRQSAIGDRSGSAHRPSPTAHGPRALPLDEALAIARQIAEALEAAHEQGIIHRDLKPANIKVRPDGTVKVLDFGLAKAIEPVGAISPGVTHSPTITTPAMTQAGLILGTAAYMSPEQAKGQPADKRSDVWAFGCVLYEMLTARRAFDGEDVSDTLAAVLRGEPAWGALPDGLPPAILELIQRSLAKDRRRRIADVAVALFVLTGPSQASRVTRTKRANAVTGHPIAAIAAALVAIVGIAAGGWWMGARSRPAEPKLVARFGVQLRGDEQFSNVGGNLIALSPDGKYLAYIANRRLNVRHLDRLESIPIRGTEFDASPVATMRSPFFSPNGQWIGFSQEGQIKKVSINGGAPVPIVPAVNASGYAWEDDGTILFAEGDNILRVPEAGGTPEVIVASVKGRVQSLQLLPGKRTILFTVFPEMTANAEGTAEIVVRSLDTGQQQTLIRGGIAARYVPTGHLVYFAAGTLLAVSLDLRALALSGAPVPVAEDVASLESPGGAATTAHIAMSPSGTLAYVAGSFNTSVPRTLVWVDRLGKEESLGVPERPYVYPRLSPDGSRIAVTVNDQEQDIWIWDVGRKTLRRFTIDPAEERYSAWTPNGKRIAFGSHRGGEAGMWWQAADGTGTPERLGGFPFNRYRNLQPTTISPDGSRLVATATGRPPNLWILTLNGDPQPTPLLQTGSSPRDIGSNSTERNAEISPDGHWIAYESLEAGQFDVYVRPFPDVTGGKWPVSTNGGSQPLWARSGKELFFIDSSGALTGVRVDGQSSFTIGTPAKILDSSYVWSVPTYAGRMYDISPDGQRFLMLKESSLPDRTSRPRSITVVQNWFEELKRLVPTR